MWWVYVLIGLTAVITAVYIFYLSRPMKCGKCGSTEIKIDTIRFGQNIDTIMYHCKECGWQGQR